jgi:hypothetical protein
MSSGSSVPDPNPELINTQNFNFAKPKLFFKNIGKYAATSTYIHVRIPFNFTTVFNTKQAIAGVYDQLLEKHEEPFKSITKSVTDISLAIIEGSLEDFRDIIKALPQRTEISRRADQNDSLQSASRSRPWPCPPSIPSESPN